LLKTNTKKAKLKKQFGDRNGKKFKTKEKIEALYEMHNNQCG
jgi:hypothetical protein